MTMKPRFTQLIIFVSIISINYALEQIRVTSDMFNIPGRTNTQIIVKKEYELPGTNSGREPESQTKLPVYITTTPHSKLSELRESSQTHQKYPTERFSISDPTRLHTAFQKNRGFTPKMAVKQQKTARTSIGSKRTQIDQDEWLDRQDLMDLFYNYSSSGELLVLYCSTREKAYVRTVCRGKLKGWVQEFTDELEWDLRFETTGVLEQGRSLGASRLPSLVYLAGGSPYVFPHDLNRIERRTMYEWLTDIYRTNSYEMKDHQFERIIDGVTNEQTEKNERWLIYVEQECMNNTIIEPKPDVCRPFWWQQLARSAIGREEPQTRNPVLLSQYGPLKIGHVSLDSSDLESVLWILLRFRLPKTFDENNELRFCSIIYIKPGKHYVCLENSNSISALRVQADNPALNYDILPLTDVQKAYKINQRKADHRIYNQVYLTFGVVGGLAVIALAVTIFWGLSSPSFAARAVKH